MIALNTQDGEGKIKEVNIFGLCFHIFIEICASAKVQMLYQRYKTVNKNSLILKLVYSEDRKVTVNHYSK